MSTYSRPPTNLLRDFRNARWRICQKAEVLSAAARILSMSNDNTGRIDRKRPLIFQIYRKATA